MTGRTAFPGETVSDTIAAILQREPDWAALPANVSSPVHALIRGCLAKERRQRIGDIAVARFVLEDPASAPSWPAAIAPRPSRRRRVAVHASMWLVGVAMSGAAVWRDERSERGVEKAQFPMWCRQTSTSGVYRGHEELVYPFHDVLAE